MFPDHTVSAQPYACTVGQLENREGLCFPALFHRAFAYAVLPLLAWSAPTGFTQLTLLSLYFITDEFPVLIYIRFL